MARKTKTTSTKTTNMLQTGVDRAVTRWETSVVRVVDAYEQATSVAKPDRVANLGGAQASWVRERTHTSADTARSLLS